MSRDRVRQPPNTSDVSEVGLEGFVEGEMLGTEPSDSDICDQHSSFPYPATDLRHARARCSSSTLFDEARPVSGHEGSWAYHPKQEGPDALNQPQQHQQQQQHQPHSQSDYRSSFDQQHKKPAIILDDQKLQQHSGFSQHRNNKKMNEALEAAGKGKMLNGHNSTDSSTESPSWTAGAAHLKIEPSASVRTTSVQRQGQQENKGSRIEHGAKASSPMTAPLTPLTPTPTELDKPTKNLMIFNKIPRQWPASQETLHHNYTAKANKKTPPQVIKDFDSVTAERIDRVINKDRPLSRAAKERLAAEQKEIELEARGFFDPARRWKGRDVYPRPASWVYCRRTKNNWLEKTKVLADTYKLFKGQILGKGHHADVYKGIDMTTGQDLAIKVIYKAVTRRLGFVNEDPMQEVKNRRLLNEAWFIDYLKDGPGICKMIRVVETATKYYFVMELAQSDLNSYSNGINMREEEIRHIIRPIFECLKYAHSHDITHRDIKPENILLRTKKDWLRNNSQGSNGSYSSSRQSSNSNNNKKGSSQGRGRSLRNLDDGSSTLSSTFANESSYMDTTDGRSSMDSSTLYNFDHRFDAFLADWGLAVEHDCNSGRKPVGTPLYAAPEVVRKMKRIRRREWINYRACDIWSLGVTMFVVASGIYPYHTHDALEAQSPPNWSALEASGMSQEYIAFTQRLMNLTAEHRPSAAEACDDPWLQA
ncbi:Serine/threonine-protein kinase D3 [Mortierella polycephala]|uniref:Serine/threonine-protein kinase D3 n=1 Tax=Mortierella polycephala TaxID=41804 RepID=A0A9P6U6K1_9FUNG|nr:Serine/threonine-protein kinase D3 [Mortierella polycephala]